MPVCDKQFYGHKAPDDRLAEDDRVILKAGDEEQDEDDLAQKLDDAGQQGQHLLAHALQSVAGGEQHSQHGVEGCVPDQIPYAVFQHHRLRRAGHQLYHPLRTCRHEQDSSHSHHDTVEIDVPHSAADAVGMVRAVVLGDVGRAGRGHRRQGHIRKSEELSGRGVSRDDQRTEAVDAVLQNDRARRDDAAHEAHGDALAEQLPIEAALHMEVLFPGQEQPGAAEDIQDAERHRHALRDDRRHTGTGHAHAQHGDEPEVEDDVEHRREDEEDQRHEAVADGPQQAGAEVIGKHDDDAEVDDDDIAVGVL